MNAILEVAGKIEIYGICYEFIFMESVWLLYISFSKDWEVNTMVYGFKVHSEISGFKIVMSIDSINDIGGGEKTGLSIF